MRFFLISVLAIILTSSCSRDIINQEMHDYIKTKEHDESLYGWWQSCDDPNQYLLFEDKDFNEEIIKCDITDIDKLKSIFEKHSLDRKSVV